jgi:hypothetical protein
MAIIFLSYVFFGIFRHIAHSRKAKLSKCQP